MPPDATEIPEEAISAWPAGFPIEAAREMWERIGRTAFLREVQHQVHSREGAMFADVVFQRVAHEKLPTLAGRELWIDPAVGAGESGSSCGFLAGGRGVAEDGKLRFYIEFAHEERMSPEAALRFAYDVCRRMGIRRVGVETDQGGETWRPLAERIFAEGDAAHAEKRDRITFVSAKAGATGQSKYERWLRLLAGYERKEVVHVEGVSATAVETALLRLPDREPFDLADTAFWCWWSVLDKLRSRWRAI
jgi:hypothetical protein